MSTSKIHQPRGLTKHTPVSNQSVQSKTSQVFRSIGGTTFTSDNRNIEIELRSGGLLVPKSFKLTGSIRQNGTHDENVYLNGAGIHSIVDQIHVSYNGQNLISLNSNAGYVACLDQNLNESVEELKFATVKALKGTAMTPGSYHGFSMDLSKFGLNIEKFMAVSQTSIQVRIILADPAKAFHGVNPSSAKVAAYEISDLRLVADSYTLSPQAHRMVESAINGSSGDTYISQVYTQNTMNLVSSEDQDLQIPMSYRNVVSTYFLPILSPIEGQTNTNIPLTDPIGNLTYNGSSPHFASNVRVQFQGSNLYVNQNAAEGESKKSDHFESILNAARDSPDSKSFASGLADGYAANTYQVLGYSFLRSEYNNPQMVDSGVNGFGFNGLLRAQFTLDTAPTGRKLLVVGRVTNQMEVKNGAVRVAM
jgi:hypothetical protein